MSKSSLTLLHTADVQAKAFERRLASRGVTGRHEVRADLLARAMSNGIDTLLASEIDAWLMLARRTSDAVLCTCSTLGPRVDALEDSQIIRVDRPLMRAAAAIDAPILLAYCLASTATASRALLDDERRRAQHDRLVVELHIEGAWSAFEAGELALYHRDIGAAINSHLSGNLASSTVVLAQASMADAAALVEAEHVLSAPELALDALLAG